MRSTTYIYKIMIMDDELIDVFDLAMNKMDSMGILLGLHTWGFDWETWGIHIKNGLVLEREMPDKARALVETTPITLDT